MGNLPLYRKHAKIDVTSTPHAVDDEAQLLSQNQLHHFVPDSAVKWLERIDLHAGSSLDSYRIRRTADQKCRVENKPVQVVQMSTRWTICGTFVTFLLIGSVSVIILSKFLDAKILSIQFNSILSINSYEMPFTQECANEKTPFIEPTKLYPSWHTRTGQEREHTMPSCRGVQLPDVALVIGREGDFDAPIEENFLKYLWPNIFVKRRNFGFESGKYPKGRYESENLLFTGAKFGPEECGMKVGDYKNGSTVFCIRAEDLAKDATDTPPAGKMETEKNGDKFWGTSKAPIYITGRYGDQTYRLVDINLCRCGYTGSDCKYFHEPQVYPTAKLSVPFNNSWGQGAECATNASFIETINDLDFDVYFRFEEENWQKREKKLKTDKWRFFVYDHLYPRKLESKVNLRLNKATLEGGFLLPEWMDPFGWHNKKRSAYEEKEWLSFDHYVTEQHNNNQYDHHDESIETWILDLQIKQMMAPIERHVTIRLMDWQEMLTEISGSAEGCWFLGFVCVSFLYYAIKCRARQRTRGTDDSGGQDAYQYLLQEDATSVTIEHEHEEFDSIKFNITRLQDDVDQFLGRSGSFYRANSV